MVSEEHPFARIGLCENRTVQRNETQNLVLRVFQRPSERSSATLSVPARDFKVIQSSEASHGVAGPGGSG